MKKSCLIKFGIVLSICSVLGTGCAVGVRGPGGEVAVSTDPGVVYADSEPPPAYAETVPVAPGADFVWIGGAWVWGGGRWGWEGGRWERPPHAGMRFVPHRYEYRGGRRVFV